MSPLQKYKNSILYFCKCNNLSYKFQFSNYISLVCNNLSLEKHIALQKKISLTVKLRKTVNILILFQQVIVVLINHAYKVSLKYGRNPLATKYAPLLFPFFSSNLISLFSKTLIFFVFMVFKVSP